MGALQEQSTIYPKDSFQMSLTSFDGKGVMIGEGEAECPDPKTGHDDYCEQLDNKALLAHLESDGR